MSNGSLPQATPGKVGEPGVEVSIIIACFNGGALVRKTLDAVMAQETSRRFEVIVVDSGSSPETMDILSRFPIRLIRIPHEQFNHGLTRDLGAAQARGDILVFLNQDAQPGTTAWLDLMIAPLERSGEILAVQGRERERTDSRGFFWNACRRGFSYTSETRRWMRRYSHIGFSTVNCAMRRSAWERAPFGAMDVMEDKSFQARVHLKGNEIVFSDGWVYHSHDFNWLQLKKRIQDEGFGWRLVGVSYSVWQLLGDLFRLSKYVELVKGLIRGRVKSMAEILFPVVRPLWLYKGNRWNRGLLKDGSS